MIIYVKGKVFLSLELVELEDQNVVDFGVWVDADI